MWMHSSASSSSKNLLVFCTNKLKKKTKKKKLEITYVFEKGLLWERFRVLLSVRLSQTYTLQIFQALVRHQSRLLGQEGLSQGDS